MKLIHARNAFMFLVFSALLFVTSFAFAQGFQPDYVWSKNFSLRYQSAQPDILIFGDSIFDGWSGYLLHTFPKAVVDAKVSRQFSSVVMDYDQLMHYSGIRNIPIIVLELGTNGPIHRADIESFMQDAGQRSIYWITPSVPRSWQNEVLERIYWAAERYPNIHIVHWHQLAENHAEWFRGGRGVHPNWTGIQEEVGLLRETMESSRHQVREP